MIKTTLRAALAVVVAACGASILYAQAPRGQVKAGFAEATINPPRGIGMTGFGPRDYAQGNQGIHDDVYVTALFVTDGREQVLLVGHDLCFFSRDEADRLKGAIGRRLDLRPSQILLNAAHNHAGPRSSHWYYESPDPYYLTNAVEPATVSAAVRAKDSAQEVTMWVGEGETRLPMNRRRPNKETGKPDFAPYPAGLVYSKLPVVIFKDQAGKPIYVLFSVSAHASSVGGDDRAFLISADYPGAARQALKQRLGLQGAVFLQGAGGSSKASLNGKTFLDGTWENVQQAGELVASEVIDCISNGLTQVEPSIVTKEIEMQWPMQPAPTRDEFAAILSKPASSGLAGEGRSMWARDMIARLDQGYRLPQVVP